jgi:hypothetical protein
LVQIVLALRPTRGLTRNLHRREQQSNKRPDNGDDDE